MDHVNERQTTTRYELPMRHFATLDAMRGLAAIFVMLWHAARHPLVPQSGYLAVDVFFGLSGFVMAMSYEQRIREGLSPLNFMLLRIARLWPMVIVGALLTLLLPASWPWTVFLIPDLRPGVEKLFPLNHSFWSLLIEMLAYLGFALAGHRIGVRGLLSIMLAAAVVLGVLTSTEDTLLRSYGANRDTVIGGIARAGFAFPCGVLMYRWRHAQGMPQVTTRLAWIIPLAMVTLLYAIPRQGNSEGLLAMLIVIPSLLWLATGLELPEVRAAGWLAALSYPLYCIHMPLLLIASQLEMPLVPVLVALVGLSWLLDRYVDQPVRRWVRGLTENRLRAA